MCLEILRLKRKILIKGEKKSCKSLLKLLIVKKDVHFGEKFSYLEPQAQKSTLTVRNINN